MGEDKNKSINLPWGKRRTTLAWIENNKMRRKARFQEERVAVDKNW